jgi:pyruvate,water dikinase
MLATTPAPSDFPVQWENPTDAELFWFRESVHFPDPVKLLDFAFCVQGIERGYRKAAQQYGIPGDTYDRLFNTYVYEAVAAPDGSPDAVAAQLEEAQQQLTVATLDLQTTWDTVWLPEIQHHLAWWEALDLPNAPLPLLIDDLQESHARLHRLWEIHFLLFFPMVFAISRFDELYQDLFGADQLAAYALLAGFPNKTIESDIALWQLSRQALAVPEVAQVFASAEAPQVLAELSRQTAGKAFIAQLDTYLQQYGRRGDKWSLLAESWLEEPTPAIKSLQDHIRQPQRNLAAELQQVAATREQLVAQARATLQGYPQPIITEFETRLRAAQVGYTLKEEHGFWLDFQGIYQARRLCLALGQRLAAQGAIAAPTDLFYLQPDELQESVTDYRPLITARRATEQHFAAITPPPTLGIAPDDNAPTDAISLAIGKVMGRPPTPMVGNQLHGIAGSPGQVQGVAKVLHSLADAPKLLPGEILVASMTTPSWAPLFATAAAVVTDGGGVLSHCAIIAREYGIPAVVSTGLATATIQDGQRLAVDGSTGVVVLLSDQLSA